jgi:hypothetical protein
VNSPARTDATSAVEAAILSTLARAERPLKGGAIAARAGRRYHGYFRQCLSRLKRAGRIRLLADGYWDAGRPVPDRGAG